MEWKMKQTRFKRWKHPTFDEKGMTKWNWMCQYGENLKLDKNTDIGAFTYINAKSIRLLQVRQEIYNDIGRGYS